MAAIAARASGTQRRWYVLAIAPNQERAVVKFLSPSDADIAQADKCWPMLGKHLRERRCAIYVPMMREKRTRGIMRRKIVVEKPMFPGYGFVQLDWEADGGRIVWLRGAPGVLDFVRQGDCYAMLDDPIIERIRSAEVAAQVPRGKASIFANGEKVTIETGPFAGLPAMIDRLDETERVGLLVSLFGRAARVSVEYDAIAKL